MGKPTRPPKRKDSNHFTPNHYNAAHSSGAFSFFNPTARYHILAPSGRNEVEPTTEKRKPTQGQESDELSLNGHEAASVLGKTAAKDDDTQNPQDKTVASLPQDTDIPTLSADQIGRALEATDSQLSAQSSLNNAANAATVSPERLAGALDTSPSQVGRVMQLGMGNSNGNASKTSINTTQRKQREQEQKDSGVYYIWRSRDNRKGRHAAVVTKPGILQQGKNSRHKKGGNNNNKGGNNKGGQDENGGNRGTGKHGSWRHKRRLQDEEMGEGIEAEDTREEERGDGPRATNTWQMTWHGILKMFTSFPWWDISYCVALTYFIGMCPPILSAIDEWPLSPSGTRMGVRELETTRPVTDATKQPP